MEDNSSALSFCIVVLLLFLSEKAGYIVLLNSHDRTTKELLMHYYMPELLCVKSQWSV